ncbi:MAG: hypothetical protein P8Y18_10175 [Candidatus Bathyarchaeota archaeon]
MSTLATITTPKIQKPMKTVVIVNKVDTDYKEIKKFIDKHSLKAFSKMFFKKPKPYEIECDSINLIYECFAILNIKYHLVRITAKEHVIDESSKRLAFDRKGRSINPKQIPSSKTETNPIDFLNSDNVLVRHLDVSIPEILRKTIKKPPEDIDQIIDEHFEITSQALIYTPIFEARIINLKSQEIKIIPVCGVTGKQFTI